MVCSLLGGAIADRIERRRLMFGAQLAIAVSATALATITFAGDPPVPLIFLFAALLAAGATVDNVTRSAIVPALAGDRLRAALSIIYGLHQVSAVVGPALGGLMIAALGVGSAYTAQAIGFVIMIGITAALPKLYPAPTDTEHPPVLKSIVEGLSFVRRQQRADGLVRDRPRRDDVRHAARAVRRARADRLRRRREPAPACSTRAVSAGATVAALTTGWVEHARWLGRIVIGEVIVWGLAIAAAGFMPSLWPAAALLAVAGAADSVSAVCRCIINQTVTPEAAAEAGCRRSSCSW